LVDSLSGLRLIGFLEDNRELSAGESGVSGTGDSIGRPKDASAISPRPSVTQLVGA